MGSLTPTQISLLNRAADDAFDGVETAFPKEGRVLVTGATGMLGGALCRALLRASARNHSGLTVVVPVRDPERAKTALAPWAGKGANLEVVHWPVFGKRLKAPPADWAVHAAAPTSSLAMAREPLNTIWGILEGTRNFLEWARVSRVRKAVFLSSLEMYGRPPEGSPVMTEDINGFLDPMRPRSSYAEGKRAAEALCAAYAGQCGVPVCVARPTQIFGPGAEVGDTRLFADFARHAVHGEDIVLHTAGRTSRNYCHLLDALSAIAVLLRSGSPGEAYNVAREDSYIDVRSLAVFFQKRAGGQGGVVFDGAGEAAHGYAPEMCIRLSTAKLEALGWQARFGLERMVDDLLAWERARRM